ncbi:hypothetical protein GCM10007216_19420 [Thalassobacillus devorans]|uniref:Uncharacterized protein n=1 Tax=Thalassobacillus devorans TaxID=279813 RepID=A0ABQ1P0N8_9BACI|nr:hypothetical protein [Thalassobacillus devorans]NIK28115.1 hypothetical protein [Thalassobacillus devorans]GGC88761.1 hypothetical protein GCM10007216_19420 [Thalassobacillus devorans]
MTGTAVLLENNKYIVLEEVERTLIEGIAKTHISGKESIDHLSLVGFKEEEIDWEYGY